MIYTDAGECGRDKNGQKRFICLATDEYGEILDFSFVTNGNSSYYPELRAIYVGLRYAVNHDIHNCWVLNDNINVVPIVNSNNGVGKGHHNREKVLKLKQKAHSILKLINATVLWVPRDKNIAGLIIEKRQREGIAKRAPLRNNHKNQKYVNSAILKISKTYARM